MSTRVIQGISRKLTNKNAKFVVKYTLSQKNNGTNTLKYTYSKKIYVKPRKKYSYK